MSIVLSSDSEELIQQEMQSGRYCSADEVVSQALHLLQQKRRHDALRHEIQLAVDAVERGEVSTWDPEEIKEELRRRMAARGQTF